MKVFENLNLQKNQLTNLTFEKLNVSPTSRVEGQGYYNTSDKHLKLFDGAQWRTLAYESELGANSEYIPIYNHNEINFSGHDSAYTDIYIGFRDEEKAITAYKFCDGLEKGAYADIWCKNIYASNIPHVYAYNLQCELSDKTSFNITFYANSKDYTIENLLSLYGCTIDTQVYYPCTGVGLSPFRVISGLILNLGAVTVKYVEYDGANASEKSSVLSRYTKNVIQIA